MSVGLTKSLGLVSEIKGYTSLGLDLIYETEGLLVLVSVSLVRLKGYESRSCLDCETPTLFSLVLGLAL